MKHLFKAVALLVAVMISSAVYAQDSFNSSDDSYIEYVRANITPDTWESFCLPFEVSIVELSMYFDHIYIMGKDQGELLYDNAAESPMSSPRRVTAIPRPLGSFGFSAPGSNYYHLFFCDVVDCQASLTRGVPFFGHVREGVGDEITLNGFSYFDDEEAETISFPTQFMMYGNKALSLVWCDDERYIATKGIVSEASTLSDDGLTYFEMNPEGKFERIEQSDVEVGHAYVACLADSRTKIVKYSRTLHELMEISSLTHGEIIDYLDLDDTAPELLEGDYLPGNVTYSRDEESGHFATFCMPFDFNANDVTGFDEVYFIQPFALYNAETEHLRLFFYSANDIDGFDGYILAGEPFVAFVDGPVEIKNFIPTHYNENFDKTVWDTDINVYDWNEVGGLTPRNRDLNVVFSGTMDDTSFDTATLEGTINLFDSEGGIVNLDLADNLPAYRSILAVETLGTSNVKAIDTSFRDFDDDETTAIRSMLTNQSSGSSNAVYSIDGRMIMRGSDMNNLKPGVYIVNGKKVVKN